MEAIDPFLICMYTDSNGLHHFPDVVIIYIRKEQRVFTIRYRVISYDCMVFQKESTGWGIFMGIVPAARNSTFLGNRRRPHSRSKCHPSFIMVCGLRVSDWFMRLYHELNRCTEWWVDRMTELLLGWWFVRGLPSFRIIHGSMIVNYGQSIWTIQCISAQGRIGLSQTWICWFESPLSQRTEIL